jgi:hypothetical protein
MHDLELPQKITHLGRYRIKEELTLILCVGIIVISQSFLSVNILIFFYTKISPFFFLSRFYKETLSTEAMLRSLMMMTI